MKAIAAVTFFGFRLLYATPSQEDHEKAATNPHYFVHVILSGIVKDMVFPGPPNFVSVEGGDWAEPRWIRENLLAFLWYIMIRMGIKPSGTTIKMAR